MLKKSPQKEKLSNLVGVTIAEKFSGNLQHSHAVGTTDITIVENQTLEIIKNFGGMMNRSPKVGLWRHLILSLLLRRIRAFKVPSIYNLCYEHLEATYPTFDMIVVEELSTQKWDSTVKKILKLHVTMKLRPLYIEIVKNVVFLCPEMKPKFKKSLTATDYKEV